MVEIGSLEPIARHSLRIRQAIGPFNILINRCTTANNRIIARLGPDEWLLLGGADETTALQGTFHSLVDIGHRHLGLQVSGTHARDVLNAGCPLDLDDNIFPPGSATRTLLGKAEIVLLRPNTQLSYRVECWRSFAPYVLSLLEQAALEFKSD